VLIKHSLPTFNPQPIIVTLLATFKPLYMEVIMYSPAGKLIVKPAPSSSPVVLV
jgi:hypothetical protein